MRTKLMLVVGLAATLVMLAGVAYAAVDVKFDDNFSPNKANKSAGVTVNIQSSDPAAEQPPIMNRIQISFPSGGKWNGPKFPKCSEQILLGQGPNGCPPKSRIGCKCFNTVTASPGKFDGFGRGYAKPVVTEPVDADLLIFNGGNSILVYVNPNLGPQFVTTCKVVGGYNLDCTIPAIRTVGDAPDASVGTVNTKTKAASAKKGKKKVGIVVTPKKCKKNWKASATFSFRTGEKVKKTFTQKCKK